MKAFSRQAQGICKNANCVIWFYVVFHAQKVPKFTNREEPRYLFRSYIQTIAYDAYKIFVKIIVQII